MTNFACELCKEKYNNVEKLPRLLPFCGHTYCSECISSRILQSKDLKLRCPIDDIEGADITTEININYFPVNHALISILPSKVIENTSDICQAHNKVLNYVCVKDSVRVCTECLLSGNHVGHKYMKEEQFKLASKKTSEKCKKDVNQISSQINRLQLSIKPDQYSESIISRQNMLIGEIENYYNEIKDRLQLCQEKSIEQIRETMAPLSNITEYVKQGLQSILEKKQILQKILDNNEIINQENFTNEIKNISSMIEEIVRKNKELDYRKLQNIVLRSNANRAQDDILNSVQIINLDETRTSKDHQQKDNSQDIDATLFKKSLTDDGGLSGADGSTSGTRSARRENSVKDKQGPILNFEPISFRVGPKEDIKCNTKGQPSQFSPGIKEISDEEDNNTLLDERIDKAITHGSSFNRETSYMNKNSIMHQKRKTLNNIKYKSNGTNNSSLRTQTNTLRNILSGNQTKYKCFQRSASLIDGIKISNTQNKEYDNNGDDSLILPTVNTEDSMNMPKDVYSKTKHSGMSRGKGSKTHRGLLCSEEFQTMDNSLFLSQSQYGVLRELGLDKGFPESSSKCSDRILYGKKSITDSKLKELIPSIVANKRVIDIELQNNFLTDSGVLKLLVSLQNHLCLKNISFASNKLSNDFLIKSEKYLLKLSSLQVLDLRSNKGITDKYKMSTFSSKLYSHKIKVLF